MRISTYITTLNEVSELVLDLLKNEYLFDDAALKQANESLTNFLGKIKETCQVLIEYPYVDKVYRDSYYNYFSTKLRKYYRDCIRLSVFDIEVNFEDFRTTDRVSFLNDNYLGFLVIRPTEPNIIGRNVISPKALKYSKFHACLTRISTTANGVKLHVLGYPHSSQDGESITCAETTIWSLMEYFSNKYPEYRPSLPSRIIKTLNSVTSERQLPSSGLKIQQISFALREFGFGTTIYSRKTYNEDFDKLISCYIESGIPLIVAIDDHPIDKIGHAIICMGRDALKAQDIDKLPVTKLSSVNLQNTLLAKGICYYNWDDLKKKFIFIDDNFPPYQGAFLDAPTRHYQKRIWHTCRINHFIAPLYSKIYLEAFVAKAFVDNLLIAGPDPLEDNTKVFIKFFLTSSRSFKNCLALNASFQADIKQIILETPMPKFIWITELSTKELIKQNRANGLVILDATEANTNDNKPLLFAAYQGKIITNENGREGLKKKELNLQPFKIYSNNLS